MGEIVALVPFGSNHDCPLLHRKADGPLLRLPDGPLHRIVLAVEEIGISEVAVVSYVDVMGAGPDEGANDGFGEEEARRVARLDRGNPHIGGNPYDAKAVRGR